MKGPNQYGPVLFVLDLNILLQLPTGSDILVTKENPIHWRDNQKPEDRYYQSADELAANICFGNFNKMLVIQTPSGMVEFPNRPVQIALDNPQKQVSCGEDAYTHAYNRLQQAARAGKVHAKIERHDCRGDCICIEKYARYSHQQMDFWFT